jgi:hypothetical protein
LQKSRVSQSGRSHGKTSQREATDRMETMKLVEVIYVAQSAAANRNAELGGCSGYRK